MRSTQTSAEKNQADRRRYGRGGQGQDQPPVPSANRRGELDEIKARLKHNDALLKHYPELIYETGQLLRKVKEEGLYRLDDPNVSGGDWVDGHYSVKRDQAGRYMQV